MSAQATGSHPSIVANIRTIMDKSGGRSLPDPMVAVAAALRKARTSAGVSLDALGELIGESAANISRWERAERDVKIEYVVRIEAALDLPRGYIWRQAGLCEPCDDVLTAIANDSSLSGPARRALADVYEALLRQLPASSSPSEESSSGPGGSKISRARSTRARMDRRK